MVRRSFVGFAAQAIGAMATLANSHAGFQQYCESFNASTPSTSGVCFASTYIPAGTELQLNEVDATCGIFSQAVSVNLCRVVGQVPTSDRSGFWFEAWLPEDWSGRFVTTGAAVLAGSHSTMMWSMGSLSDSQPSQPTTDIRDIPDPFPSQPRRGSGLCLPLHREGCLHRQVSRPRILWQLLY